MSLTPDEVIAIRDRWRMVARQIEDMLCADGGFTGTIEVNCLHGYVKQYYERQAHNPDDIERRREERKAG